MRNSYEVRRLGTREKWRRGAGLVDRFLLGKWGVEAKCGLWIPPVVWYSSGHSMDGREDRPAIAISRLGWFADRRSLPVKLARLELSGFKSFADYTEFVFDDGITGIVGPNGCGKSNVVDAVKWVLGEMSAKSLRGDAMLDVIFNGSGGRKPMGMAEVSLTFTNEDRRLPMDTETVKVTRRLYRDATSEYLINNGMARLKDIRELFLDTGIGVDAYSLIEQGRVAAAVGFEFI